MLLTYKFGSTAAPGAAEREIQQLLNELKLCSQQLDHIQSRIESKLLSSPPVEEQSWRLTGNGWILSAPNGTGIRLSAEERAMLMLLMQQSSSGGVVTRAELVASIFNARKTDSSISQIEKTLPGLIFRLRQKGARKGFTIPICPIRNKGYIFAEQASTEATGTQMESYS